MKVVVLHFCIFVDEKVRFSFLWTWSVLRKGIFGFPNDFRLRVRATRNSCFRSARVLTMSADRIAIFPSRGAQTLMKGRLKVRFTRNNFLKGVWHEIFVFRYFLEPVSSGHLSIRLEMAPIGNSGAGGKLKSKISCQTPCNFRTVLLL
jgi:hypothetical protein